MTIETIIRVALLKKYYKLEDQAFNLVLQKTKHLDHYDKDQIIDRVKRFFSDLQEIFWDNRELTAIEEIAEYIDKL